MTNLSERSESENKDEMASPIECLGRKNHYVWLDHNLQAFFSVLGVECNNGIISAHGDKCYGYRDKWDKAGIPFAHGVAVYLLSHTPPWSETCRNTNDGFVDPGDWVISAYKQMRNLLAEA